MPDARQLPVAGALDRVMAALEASRRCVLQAPPGSGKTTLVPPALLGSGLLPESAPEVVLLQPRRAAARMVARRLASQRGEPVGRTVGYEVRFDRQVSSDTRLRVVTEGVLTARLQRDPELKGVGAVVLDEFHERSLDADLALALLVEVQEALREDLLLVVMSATLDAEPLARFLGCEAVRTDGRLFPVEVEWAAAPDDRPIAAQVASGVRRAIEAAPGDGGVLAFLPGVRDIEAARQQLADLSRSGWDVDPLYGRLDAREQDRVLAGARPGRRQVVLATNIAETSVTLEGVTAVVDSGWHKQIRHDAGLGVDRLELARISKASAEQRAGRAGRVRPGVCLRLWTEHEHRGLAEFDRPEIRRVGLARLVLDLRVWGVPDPREFGFFEPPEEAALARAEALLADLGATEGAAGDLTAIGRMIARVPADPRVARYLIEARGDARLREAAEIGALLAEGRRPDLSRGQGGGAADVLVMWKGGAMRSRRVRAVAGQLERVARKLPRTPAPPEGEADLDDAVCRWLLAGWPDRVARRRELGSRELVLVGGRGARVHEGSAVTGGELLLALDVAAGRRGSHARSLVRSAARLEEAWLEARGEVTEADEVRWDDARGRAVAVRVRRYRDLALSEATIPLQDRVAAARLLQEAAARDPEAALAPGDKDEVVIARLVSAGTWAPEAGLPATREEALRSVLPALCVGRSSLGELRGQRVGAALMQGLTWKQRQALEAVAPEALEVPSGRAVRLEYRLDGPPVLAAKVQELFGMRETPSVARGKVPVVVHLLSPASRPLQVTTDLASFWTTTWPEVRKEMRARYPKHRWPEDPLTAEASVRTTKKRR